MKKIVLLVFIAFFTSLCHACASNRVVIQQSLSSEYAGQCIPVQYKVIYAEGVNVSDHLRTLINQKLQEYVDDKAWWGNDLKKVSLSILVTHIKTASDVATVFVGPLASPGEISGKIVVYYEDKIIGKYKVDASYRTVSGTIVFADLEDRIAGKFASQVMYALK
jgi:hypothetical protein